MGQDLLAELAEGARVSLLVGIVSALAATAIGALIGLIAGYSGGWTDTVFMRIVDVSMTLPYLPLMIVIGVYMGPSLHTQIGVITLIMWAGKARELRSQIMALRGRGPVLAAKSMGASHVYLLRKHLLPGILPLLIPQFVRAVNMSIILESSLSFLGLGDPLAKSWGSILYYANVRNAFLTDSWIWWVIPPGVCIILTVLSFSLLGYYLEERVSPRLRGASSHARWANWATALAGNALKPKSGEAGPVLEVEGLTVTYNRTGEAVLALNHVDFTVCKGEIVGIVGESGSGKSTIASSIMGMLKQPAEVSGGFIRLQGEELNGLPPEALRQLRGRRMALIPQAAMNALNPVLTVGAQLAEAVRAHRSIGKAELRRLVEQALEQVGLSSDWSSAYPHELSGGMRQRVVIAMALINEPALVIADEPTTGLDVKVQIEIIKLLEQLQGRLGISMILISHDLPVVLRLADKIVMLENGKIVDEGEAATLARSPSHPYTRRLMEAIPRISATKAAEE
ncbi:ATP-binding cassette domain-containing protein [Cohnella faecalis]|uniref:ATP-binding cassette domain-containing protein n=2 Tax=Cohnella faecalis TaxID=2315694 RepID=A0A398CWD7_9BACL|nr:ATP-binding cassette domain-containing protein [Cohnella faecalis]